MLVVVRTVDDEVIERLFDVYAESMSDLSCDFSSEEEMRSSYREFLEDFVSQPGQLVPRAGSMARPFSSHSS